MFELKKPMLADNKPWNPIHVEANLPLLGFTKLDGIRMLVSNGVGYSRSLKPLPNKQLQALVAAEANELEGFDGEIIVGDPTDEFCFKNSHRACMKGDLEAKHTFYVFDKWDSTEQYLDRISLVKEQLATVPSRLAVALDFEVLETMEQVMSFAENLLSKGHEGAIFRRADAPYKNGRTTSKSGWMYKFKSRVDTEITITGFHELMVNNNPKVINELGRSHRSSHQANKTPGGTLGAVEGTGFFEDGLPFTTKIGVFSGFTKDDLQKIWNKREKFLGAKMKIKYMGVGSDAAPRTPTALGFRDEKDMG